MKSWKYKFLEKVLLGPKINTNDEDEVIDNCISLSYRAMLTTGRYYIKSNNTIRKKFKTLLEDNNYRFSRKLIIDTAKLFEINEPIQNGNKHVTRFGLSQKLVNMTFKYFYVFYDYIKKPIEFKNCDCPLDSIILNKLNKKIIWSKCNEEQYTECQDKIEYELGSINIDDELKQLGKLAYDFLNW